jgi:hypothetical protein
MDDTDGLYQLTLGTMHKALSSVIQNKDFLEGWRANVKDLGEALTQYHQALAKVVASGEFTETGKARRKAELQKQLSERLKAEEEKNLAGYDRHLDQLRRTAKRREAPSDLGQVLDYLRGQELRAEIRKLDEVTIRAEYESRSQDTSGRFDEWLRAVEDSPVPLLPGEVLDRGRESRTLRSLDPATRQTIADLQELRDAHRHFVGLVRRELPERDVIAEMAAGTSADAS